MVLRISMRRRVTLCTVWMAVLVGVIGYDKIGILPVSAFVPQRCVIPSRQVHLGHTPWNTYPQKVRTHVVRVATTRVQEEERLTVPEDGTFSFRGCREVSHPGSRPSMTVAKTFRAFADKTGGLWRTRCLGLIPTTKARRHVVMGASSRVQQDEPLTIPQDDTFSILGWWREFSYSGSRPSTKVANTFKYFAEKTGGIWKTRSLGFMPATMLAAPTTTSWIKKVDASNLLKTSWPKSAMALIGEKSVLSSDLTPEQHGSLRDMYLKSIGPSTILSVQPLVEFLVDKYIKKIERYAETGEAFQLVPILKDLSLDVIVSCFLGDVVTQDELDIIRESFDILEPGLVSIPVVLPWPLSRTPLAKMRPFNYGRAMEAREVVSKTILNIADRRRKELSSADKWESKYVIDTVLEKQALQRANGGLAEGEMEVDETFIIDNVIISLLGGLGATITSTSRAVHLLTAPESKYAANDILNEVFTTDLKVGSEAAGGLYANFPYIRSLTLETARLFPPVFGVLRKPVEDLNYNGYTLPKDESILWSYLPSAMHDEYYPEPERACPFRFLSKQGPPSTAQSTGEPRKADEPGQPQPPMFGFGRHFCPGRELSKLEVILIIKKLFGKFDVHLEEDQDLTGTFVQNIPLGGLKIRISKKTPVPVA